MKTEAKTINNKLKIIQALNNCETCFLGINDKDFPYVIPMNFGFTAIKGKIVLYFSSNSIGKKIKLLKKNSKVSFSMITSVYFIEEEKAENCTTTYQSITGNGIVHFINDNEQKKLAIKHIMAHYFQKSFDITEEDIVKNEIFYIDIEKIDCRINPIKSI